MIIPFGNLKREYNEISSEIDSVISETVRSGWYILGKNLELFEKNFSEYTGSKFTVGCANGTEAITLALRALGIQQDDEVITQTNTCVPTVCGIVNSGAKPVFCDVLENSLMINPFDVESKICDKTKALLPVNLFGASADFDKIMKISGKYSIPVIEDCAQSHGSSYGGRYTGTFGIMGCFSFYPTKNLGCYGDGGAVITSDTDLYKKLILLRNYGQDKRYYHSVHGLNSRLDEIQAAVLNVKLKYLERWNERRREIAKIYDEGFSNNTNIIPLVFDKNTSSVYHLYIVKVKDREKLQKLLSEKGIDTLIHYPVPCHIQKAYEYLGYKTGDFPVAEENAGKILSLPISSQLKEEEIKYIIETIREFYD